MLKSILHDLFHVVDAEFLEDVVFVRVYGAYTDTETVGYLLCAKPLAAERDDFALARGKLGRCLGLLLDLHIDTVEYGGYVAPEILRTVVNAADGIRQLVRT